MKPPLQRPAGGMPRRMIAVGILLLARGQAAGLRYFDGTRQSVLAALTPLVAFLLVSVAVTLARQPDALLDLFSLVVGFLGQLVVSFEVARRWGRAGDWFRYATVFCWCQWVVPLAFAALLLIMAFLMAAGIPPETTAAAGMLILFGYVLWLHWFVARTALRLTATRAVALVLIVNAMTTALMFVPQLLAQAN